MNKNQPSAPRNDGFTIIEVLFVLAIAGLIMLLVFQAIPALQRSSRNNQRKQDVATILRAVSQYELKDSGNFPTDCSSTPSCTDSLNPGNIPPSNDYFLYYVKNKLTFYEDSGSSAGHVVLAHQSSGANPVPSTVTDPEVVYVYNYQKCNGVSAIPQGAGYSDVVALYALETGSGSATSQCQQL